MEVIIISTRGNTKTSAKKPIKSFSKRKSGRKLAKTLLPGHTEGKEKELFWV